MFIVSTICNSKVCISLISRRHSSWYNYITSFACDVLRASFLLIVGQPRYTRTGPHRGWLPRQVLMRCSLFFTLYTWSPAWLTNSYLPSYSLFLSSTGASNKDADKLKMMLLAWNYQSGLCNTTHITCGGRIMILTRRFFFIVIRSKWRSQTAGRGGRGGVAAFLENKAERGGNFLFSTMINFKISLVTMLRIKGDKGIGLYS